MSKRDDELQVRGGIEALPDEISGDEFDPDDVPVDESGQDMSDTEPMPQERGPDDEDDDFEDDPGGNDRMRDGHDTRPERRHREKSMKQSKSHDTLFAIMCILIGLLGVGGIIVGVVVAIGIYKPGATNETAAANTGPNFYYGQDGQLHINVYITKKPDMDVDITIDDDGQATVNTTVHDDESASAPTSGNQADPTQTATKPEETSKPGDEDNKDDASKTGMTDGSNDAKDPENPDDEKSSVSENETSGGTNESKDDDKTANKATKEQEDLLLGQMQERISQGKSGYLESDVLYVVIEGDTLSEISHEVGFSVDFLAAYNQIQDKNLIITGETLRIPSFKSVG